MSDFLLIHTRICIDLICFESSWKNRNWYLDFGHCGVTNDLGNSPQSSGFDLGLWWASLVVGDTTMAPILVSIPIIDIFTKVIMSHFFSVTVVMEIVYKWAKYKFRFGENQNLLFVMYIGLPDSKSPVWNWIRHSEIGEKNFQTMCLISKARVFCLPFCGGIVCYSLLDVFLLHIICAINHSLCVPDYPWSLCSLLVPLRN